MNIDDKALDGYGKEKLFFSLFSGAISINYIIMKLIVLFKTNFSFNQLLLNMKNRQK